jgi:hypothetical protein
MQSDEISLTLSRCPSRISGGGGRIYCSRELAPDATSRPLKSRPTLIIIATGRNSVSCHSPNCLCFWHGPRESSGFFSSFEIEWRASERRGAIYETCCLYILNTPRRAEIFWGLAFVNASRGTAQCQRCRNASERHLVANDCIGTKSILTLVEPISRLGFLLKSCTKSCLLKTIHL